MADLIKSAKAGNVSAQMKLASYYYKKKNFKTAAKLLRRAAKQGNSKAQYILGEMYETGKGVPVDSKKARVLYELSSKRGNSKAKTRLEAVKKKLSEEKGDPIESENKVEWKNGLHYFICNDGFKKRIVQVGDPLDAKSQKCNLDYNQELHYKGKFLNPFPSGARILEDNGYLHYICSPETSTRTFVRFTWPDHSSACSKAGFRTAATAPVSSDKSGMNSKLPDLQKRAEGGSAIDQRKLGEYYFKNKNFEKAFEWLQKAADQKDIPATFKLAEIYENGSIDGTTDYFMAFRSYLNVVSRVMSRDLRNQLQEGDNELRGKAYARMGWLKETGKAEPIDLKEAAKYYAQGAKYGSTFATGRLVELSKSSDVVKLEKTVTLASGNDHKVGTIQKGSGAGGGSYKKAQDFYYHSRDLENAFQAINKALEADSMNADYHGFKAIILSDLGLSKGNADLSNQALESVNKAIRLKPTGTFYHTRGNIFIDMRRTDEAIDSFTKAISQGTDHADRTYYGRGLANLLSNQFQAAVDDFSKAIELNPKYSKAYKNRAFAHQNLGNTNQSQVDFAKYKELQAQN